MKRDLSLAAQRFNVLMVKQKGVTRLRPDEHVKAAIDYANQLDAVMANLRRAVTLLERNLNVTRAEAIKMLTPWARDDDGRTFEDMIVLALLDEKESWEPHKGRRLEAIERITNKSPRTSDRALRHAKARSKKADK